MPKPMDLRGQKYGKLTVIELAPSGLGEKPKWRCKCECGGEFIASAFNLRQGDSTKCRDCRYFKWTADREGALRDLKAAGKTGKQIGELLGCSAYVVNSKLKQWKRDEARALMNPETGFRQHMNAPCKRACLRCGRSFEAESRVNRLCSACGPFVRGAAFI
ncbi:hypothetical protein [Komagataeibacter sp. SM21]|uniref:hypothetical protein n=1 Tax=Komagataeibacter sp. SM21 TaxID=3242899 RepID=UPI003527F0CF